MLHENERYLRLRHKTVFLLLSCSLELALACFLNSARIRNEIEDQKLADNNKAIENMRQTLGEEEFAKLESNVQANLAKFLRAGNGIEELEM